LFGRPALILPRLLPVCIIGYRTRKRAREEEKRREKDDDESELYIMSYDFDSNGSGMGVKIGRSRCTYDRAEQLAASHDLQHGHPRHLPGQGPPRGRGPQPPPGRAAHRREGREWFRVTPAEAMFAISSAMMEDDLAVTHSARMRRIWS
jgi:hypothetical protein